MKELIKRYVEVKTQIEELVNEKKDLDKKLTEELKKMEMRQIKVDKVTVSLGKRKSFVVVNEKEAIKQLEEMGLRKDYVYEHLDKQRFDIFAREMDELGKEVKGTIGKETEYLSLRVNKK